MAISVPKAAAWLGMVLAGVALTLILFSGGGGQAYIVHARFHDAAGLLPNFFVKIDQIQAGVVKSVTLNRQESEVIVTMGLDRSAAPVGTGASAEIRPANLLGEKFVQLNPGDLTHPLPSGSTIPLRRTSAPVELDDIFNTLDPNTRTSLAILINEAGLAMAGRGADFMQTLRDLPPTLSSAREVVGQISAENASLSRAIVAGNRVLASVSSRRNDLQDLIQNGKDALDAINAARTDLGRTVTAAPGGLAQLRRSLLELERAAGTLTPAAADLQSTAPALGRTLARLPQFASDAGGALSAARVVAPALDRLATESTPVLAQMRPATATLASFAQDLGPFLNVLDQQGGLREFLGFVAGWAGVTSQRDGLGHVFRLRLSIDQQLLTSALGKYAALFGAGPSRGRGAAHRAAAGNPVPAPSANGPAPSTTTATATTTGVPTVPTLPTVPTAGGVGGSPASGAGGGQTRQLLQYLLGR
jgi:virulence factor Mce-like protein